MTDACGHREHQSFRELFDSLDHRGKAPFGVHLQIADRCNHTCVHCYQVQGLKGELSEDELRHVLDGLAEAGVLLLNVSGGEATLRPDLLPLLRYARGKGFALRLYTNAFAMTEELAHALAEIGLLEVHVSVYSDRDEEHDAVTCVPGSLKRTLAGIRAMRSNGLRVIVKSPALAKARGATERLRELADAMGCLFSSSTDLTAREDGDLGPLAEAVTGDELVEHGLAGAWVPGADDEKIRRAVLAGASCAVGSGGVIILPNGDVQPCTDTPIPLGNLAVDTLPEVLANHPEMEVFRDLTWGSVHGCRDCGILLACHRCHATALHAGGDYLGPYEAACDRARARYSAGIGRTATLLPPAQDCEAGRRAERGPYMIQADGSLQPVADRITLEDDERARAHPWIRRKPEPHTETAGFVPKQRLVRRRGQQAATSNGPADRS